MKRLDFHTASHQTRPKENDHKGETEEATQSIGKKDQEKESFQTTAAPQSPLVQSKTHSVCRRMISQ